MQELQRREAVQNKNSKYGTEKGKKTSITPNDREVI